jgi:hypothetical protein
MIPTLIIVACMVGLGFLWHQRRGRDQSSGAPSVSRKKAANDFASVELRCGRTACKSARSLAGNAILAVEAPVLPLANCDASTCQCSYRKIEDRRQEDGRRTSDHGIQPLIFEGNEQRSTANDRRTS